MGAAIVAMLTGAFARVKGWMIAAGAIALAVWYAFSKGKSSAAERAELNDRASRAGRNEKAAGEISAAAKERGDVEAEIARRTADDNRERVRERWTVGADDGES